MNRLPLELRIAIGEECHTPVRLVCVAQCHRNGYLGARLCPHWGAKTLNLYALSAAGRQKHLKYALSVSHISRDEILLAFCWASLEGRLVTVQWLRQEYNFTLDELRCGHNFVFRWSCIRGHLETAKWLCDVCCITSDDIGFADYDVLLKMLRVCRQDVLRWMILRFKIDISQLSADVRKKVREYLLASPLPFLQFLMDNGFQLEAKDVLTTFHYYGTYGHLHELRALNAKFDLKTLATIRQDRFSIIYTFQEACRMNSLCTAQWIADEFSLTTAEIIPGHNNKIIREAYNNGTSAMIAWLLTRFDIGPHLLRDD